MILLYCDLLQQISRVFVVLIIYAERIVETCEARDLRRSRTDCTRLAFFHYFLEKYRPM
nr:MAG TPA: hypothetical protein [Caudoviricetes sp.]